MEFKNPHSMVQKIYTLIPSLHTYICTLCIPASSHQDKFAVEDTRSKYFKSCHVALFQDPAQSWKNPVEEVYSGFL